MKYLSIAFFAFVLFSCQSESKTFTTDEAMENFKIIEGSWALQPEGQSLEIWKPSNEGYIGQGMNIDNKNDTSYNVIYFIEKDEDRLRLQVQPVSEGGMSDPINYYLEESTKKRFVFESPTHKMPKRLIFLIHKNEYTVMNEYELEDMVQQRDLLYKKIKE